MKTRIGLRAGMFLCCYAGALGAELRAGDGKPGGVPLVFIHGIKGSVLVDEHQDVKWLTASGALGLRTPDLALPRRFVAGLQSKDDLRPKGILSKVAVIPWLLEFDVYESWLDEAAKFGRPFYTFAYDWRRENGESAAAFQQFLQDIKERHGQAPAVVAHSMGGLITLVNLLEHPELFHSVVFAGVPFGGGVAFMPDLHAGRADGLSSSILGPRVMETFPSVFTFFPLEGAGRLIHADGSSIAVDFYELESWCRLRLGPCFNGQLTHDERGFYAEILKRAKAFRQRLLAPASGLLPPVLVVASKKHPTIDQAMQDGPKSETGWDFKTPPMQPGDGRVAFALAMPPPSVAFDVLETDESHASLLRDPKVVDAIKRMGDGHSM